MAGVLDRRVAGLPVKVWIPVGAGVFALVWWWTRRRPEEAAPGEVVSFDTGVGVSTLPEAVPVPVPVERFASDSSAVSEPFPDLGGTLAEGLAQIGEQISAGFEALAATPMEPTPVEVVNPEEIAAAIGGGGGGGGDAEQRLRRRIRRITSKIQTLKEGGVTPQERKRIRRLRARRRRLRERLHA